MRVLPFMSKNRGHKPLTKKNDLRTGFSVPDSGIYRVLHPQHRLPTAVTLIKDQAFPRCSKCPEPVYFELQHAAPAAGSNRGFSVILYELPEVGEPENESLAG